MGFYAWLRVVSLWASPKCGPPTFQVSILVAFSFQCLTNTLRELIACYPGLVILTLGWGTGPALRSVLTDMTNPEKIAALYTVIALGESMGFAVGALILNRSYALAIGWDNRRYLGLPFLVATFCLLLGGVGSLLGKCCGRSRLG